MTSVICLFVLSDNLSGDISLRTFLVLYYVNFLILFYMYMENKIKYYKICDIKCGIRFLFNEVLCLKL